jgi:glycosyltransferase involved in cell wall biosynthesis
LDNCWKWGSSLYITLIQCPRFKKCTFVGAKYGEAKWDFLRSADIMVLPTYGENFGIVVAEALALGLPVITTTGTP